MGTRMNFREILWSCFRRTAPEQAAMCPPQVVRIHEPKGARAPTKTASTKQPETAGNSRKRRKRRKMPETRGTKQPENAGQHKGAPAGAPATGSGCDLGSFVDMRHKLLDMADVSGSGDVGYLRAQELGAREGLLLRRRRILGCWGCPKRCWWPAGTATMVLLLESDGVHGCPRHRTFRPTTPIWGHPFGARLAALRCALRAVRCALCAALCAVRCALCAVRCAAPRRWVPFH